MFFFVFPVMIFLRIFRFLFPLFLLYVILRIFTGIFSSGYGQQSSSSGANRGKERASRSNGGEGWKESQKHDSQTPYEVLGCSPGDPDDKIRKSYRDLVTKYHPDRFIGMDLDDDFIRLASERFSAIQEAYKQIRRLRGFS
ncbi:MAG TPA: J domain-containing protein [Synergistaceae bacterium]|nr:J domain-containing protein [Synergistaceae bacterium]HPJ25276.1 J domain-containing protein [Synergistaceae bacterium]HPQ38120.1 J domain-containing protein [Synergistaceae bacterium]